MALSKSLGVVDAAPDLREGFSINRVDKDDPYYRRTDFGKIFADNVRPDELHRAGFRTLSRTTIARCSALPAT